MDSKKNKKGYLLTLGGLSIMINEEKRIQLAKEAIGLIKEFRKEELLVSTEIAIEMEASEDGSLIFFKHEKDGEYEYELKEISEELAHDMKGFAMFGPGFYEAFDMEVSELKDKYEELSKVEFIEFVGKLYYMKYRCEEIYEKLKDIEIKAMQL